MRSQVSPITFLGLFISLFGFVTLRLLFRGLNASSSVTAAAWKELAIWLLAAVLLVIIRFGERLPLKSIGLGVSPWRQSIRYGCILTGLCGVTAWIVLSFTGYGHGPGSTEFNRIPIWFETLVVIRSGIIEELFFRGYAIERLEAIGCGRLLSATIPLLVFAATHWTGGIENIILAFFVGIILTLFYVLRRDLVANMIGHGLSDLIGLVLPRLAH